MCGIIGTIANKEVSEDIYDGLITLQHRGQDSAGIITYNQKFHLRKGVGLVRDIFSPQILTHLKGSMGVGHVRYPTVANVDVDLNENAQPFLVNAPYGIAMAHNGNIFNFSDLKKELFQKDLRYLTSDCDVEVILNIFADELIKQKSKDFPKNIFKALKKVYKRTKGSYSAVAIIAGKGFLAFRDPHGIKPLIYGTRKRGFQTEYIFASENVMLSSLGYQLAGNVEPGEAIFIDNNRKVYSQKILPKKHNPCIFEFVYFARPDALIDDISVYKSRLRMGEKLAGRIKPLKKKLNIDVVIPAPATANTAALSLAQNTGLPYREGLVLNQFIGRTFIMPSDGMRKKSVRYKLAPNELEIRNKNILLVDDSIVRGNTSRQIVQLLRDFGAKKVYLASSSPPLRFPCIYGIDMPTRGEFIANQLESIKAIEKNIGADLLMYQTLEDLIDAVRKGNPRIKRPCTACFDGKYPTGDVNATVLKKIEEERLRSVKE